MWCCIHRIERDLVLRYKMSLSKVNQALQDMSTNPKEAFDHQEKHSKHKGVSKF